jgi:hypothetical protein
MGTPALKPCPCGKTPENLSFTEGYSSKYGYVSGVCCGDWSIEFRTDYNQLKPENRPELEKLMAEAWNSALRTV